MAALTVSARTRAWVSLGLGAAVLVGTAATVGAGPFVHGVRSLTPAAVVAALALTALATAAAAWRWRALAARVGVPLTRRRAVAEYYRSQFLNSVLPGGVVGDVDRAWRHATAASDTAAAARAVVGERTAGQLVQLCVVAVALLALGAGSALAAAAWPALATAGLVAAAAIAVAASRAGRRMLRRELAALRTVFAKPGTGVTVVVASVVVLGAHSATFVIAALLVGAHAPLPELIALALLALTAGSLPINLGGWGPREASASLFAAATGLGAATGVAAGAAFGVLALIAVLPGAVFVLMRRRA
ncbi:lysylphosphatidylglycerol synthase domain-containing protein [Gryllotalpicola protaetiae]|uniref:UPF0104 family protein n=1 Tax=Gryllotalpicola protaetiae TaxID=2419771 RepID=A0A387BV78_9MICO|nr:lysylphosphatidylglycerol synthase domain-containing protein [Gryllotalpicola protaetiae]AYG02311.1 UPF0104 family protein [Gryllotalpicola protaetiae]